jgi:hypothetical protein
LRRTIAQIVTPVSSAKKVSADMMTSSSGKPIVLLTRVYPSYAQSSPQVFVVRRGPVSSATVARFTRPLQIYDATRNPCRPAAV